ncbi:MAG TPA: hypothetical protein VNR38_12100 [Ureibacillus sp.]|nr:hypothetical protein [Ureibacillus sp.]
MFFFIIMGYFIIVLIGLVIEGHLRMLREQNKEMIKLLNEQKEKRNFEGVSPLD